MSKVQRLLQQGHDEWYVERRDLYQTLLYEAHTAGSASSQKGILSFARAAGTYTPPIAPSPLPSARVLRRAHLIMEIEKMPMYRHQLLGVTGEILCIDGTRKVLKKIYGDGQGTMQYVTSVLNEWGQFVTTVVVAAAEFEGCYVRMARGLIARFRRANAPAPKVLKITTTASSLHEHVKTAARFVKQYESRWGYTLFGRCLGADSPETRAAQKTKFGWMRYPQVAQVTEDSRLLYLLLKMLKNRAPANQLSSPSKVTASLKGQYKWIVDRLRDDPILGGLAIPLPNLNSKSILTFTSKEEKKTNYRATVMPKVTSHLKVLSETLFPEAPVLPTSLLPPDRPQVQYQHLHHDAGKRRGEKRRLFVEEPEPTPVDRPILPKPTSSTYIQPKPAASTYEPPAVSAAPVLLVHRLPPLYFMGLHAVRALYL